MKCLVSKMLFLKYLLGSQEKILSKQLILAVDALMTNTDSFQKQKTYALSCWKFSITSFLKQSIQPKAESFLPRSALLPRVACHQPVTGQ